MSRKIRRVPANWDHPKDDEGHHKPLFDKNYAKAIIDYIGYELPWYVKHPRCISEFLKSWPQRESYRPIWFKSPTHYQVYEDVSEGTPISPVFVSLEEMRTWLLGEGYSEHATDRFIKSGYAPTFIMSKKGISGIGIQSLDLED